MVRFLFNKKVKNKKEILKEAEDDSHVGTGSTGRIIAETLKGSGIALPDWLSQSTKQLEVQSQLVELLGDFKESLDSPNVTFVEKKESRVEDKKSYEEQAENVMDSPRLRM